MPRYLFEATYTREGVSGLRSEGGTSRRDAVEHAAILDQGKVAVVDRQVRARLGLLGPGGRRVYCRQENGGE